MKFSSVGTIMSQLSPMFNKGHGEIKGLDGMSSIHASHLPIIKYPTCFLGNQMWQDKVIVSRDQSRCGQASPDTHGFKKMYLLKNLVANASRAFLWYLGTKGTKKNFQRQEQAFVDFLKLLRLKPLLSCLQRILLLQVFFDKP